MNRELKQIAQDRSLLTEHFIVVLPELLSKVKNSTHHYSTTLLSSPLQATLLHLQPPLYTLSHLHPYTP